jgi:hypothetical protein
MTDGMTRDVTAQARDLAHGVLAWAESQRFETFDWWDIWGTRFGQWAKLAYVRKNPAGYAAVAGLTLMDLVYPSARRFFVERRRFPISVAHFGLGFVNLWYATRDERYLTRALGMEADVLGLACPAPSGLAWGMKHEWMTVQGLVPADTPCNTQTAYPYRFFAELKEITGEQRFDEHLRRIADHVCRDFPETRNGDLLSASYSTIDNRRVVNSNSYRAYMLMDAAMRFNDPVCREKGEATARYVLAMQHPDGSWPYSEDQPFVDGYHTCFVLKNLEACRQRTTDAALKARITAGIDAGYAYFFARLFDGAGHPVPFSVEPRLTLFAHDGYDLAETIGLLAEFGVQRERLGGLLAFARRRFLTRDGWFMFRIYKGIPAVKGIPYIRYANSAMFYALTKVLRYDTAQESHGSTH